MGGFYKWLGFVENARFLQMAWLRFLLAVIPTTPLATRRFTYKNLCADNLYFQACDYCIAVGQHCHRGVVYPIKFMNQPLRNMPDHVKLVDKIQRRGNTMNEAEKQGVKGIIMLQYFMNTAYSSTSFHSLLFNVTCIISVSYTHLTLPTIYSV